LDAIPFDVPDVEHTHYGKLCTFDYFVQKYKIEDPAIHTLALIVRGADTDRHDIAPQSSGLWAIAAGLSQNIKNDNQLLEKGMMIYDALYTWAEYLQNETHTHKTRLSIYLLMFITNSLKENKKYLHWKKELKRDYSRSN
jgi:hypothetical protein